MTAAAMKREAKRREASLIASLRALQEDFRLGRIPPDPQVELAEDSGPAPVIGSLDDLIDELPRYPHHEFSGLTRRFEDDPMNLGVGLMALVAPTPEPRLWWTAVFQAPGLVQTYHIPIPVEVIAATLRSSGIDDVLALTGKPRVPTFANPFDPKNQPKRPAGSRTVYFIQPAQGGLIKIGVAQHLPSRLATLQTGSPLELRVIAVMQGGEPVERELHKRFAADRRHGEWFEPSPELLDFIAQNGAKP